MQSDVNVSVAAEAFAGRCLEQAAKQARDKQLADIVESAGQRPQVGCVLDLLRIYTYHAVLLCQAKAGAHMHVWPIAWCSSDAFQCGLSEPP